MPQILDHYDALLGKGRDSITANGAPKASSIGVQWNVSLFNGLANTNKKCIKRLHLEFKARNDLGAASRRGAKTWT